MIGVESGLRDIPHYVAPCVGVAAASAQALAGKVDYRIRLNVRDRNVAKRPGRQALEILASGYPAFIRPSAVGGKVFIHLVPRGCRVVEASGAAVSYRKVVNAFVCRLSLEGEGKPEESNDGGVLGGSGGECLGVWV